MRKPSDSDFEVELDGVGTFTYAQRTIGDFIAIRRKFIELAGSESEDPAVNAIAGVIATHAVMCVKAPEGWEDLEKIKLDRTGKIIEQLIKLDELIGEKEDSFRTDKNS